MNTELEKFSIDDAKKMIRGGDVYVMHIGFFNPEVTGYLGENLEENYPDCGYVLLLHHVNGENVHYRNTKAVFGLVIGDGDELSFEERYGLS